MLLSETDHFPFYTPTSHYRVDRLALFLFSYAYGECYFRVCYLRDYYRNESIYLTIDEGRLPEAGGHTYSLMALLPADEFTVIPTISVAVSHILENSFQMVPEEYFIPFGRAEYNADVLSERMSTSPDVAVAMTLVPVVVVPEVVPNPTSALRSAVNAVRVCNWLKTKMVF